MCFGSTPSLRTVERVPKTKRRQHLTRVFAPSVNNRARLLCRGSRQQDSNVKAAILSPELVAWLRGGSENFIVSVSGVAERLVGAGGPRVPSLR